MDEALIVSYLLGELDEGDRTRLEEQFLREADYRELIRAVEDDLIDDYVRGELSPHQRDLFERQFTTLPHRARKVELARALNKALSDGRGVSAAASAPLAFPSRHRSVSRALRYPLAAAAVLLLGFGVWFVQTSRTGSVVQPPRADQKTAAPVEPATRPDERSAPLSPQLSIATFVLPSGLVRESTATTTFVITQGTQLVRLRVPLEKGDDYPAYRAELRTASGNSVWKSDAVRVEADAAGQSVVLDVRAGLLRPDKYELTLTGVNKEVVEDIGYYYFSLVTK